MSNSDHPTIYTQTNPSGPCDPAPHTSDPEYSFPLPWSPRTAYSAPSTPVAPTTMPPVVRLPLGTTEIDDDSVVAEYVEARLRQMQCTMDDDHAVQKVVLELIHKAHLTTSVFKALRGMPIHSAELTIV